MTYELKSLRRQKVLYNSANATNPLVFQLVLNDVKVTPTSATITIYAPGNTTALVSAAAMTVSGTLLTYTVTTTTTASWPVDTGYRAEIAVTYSGAVYSRVIVFDVVAYLLDLAIGVDQLVDIDERVAGMVHNGSTDMVGLITAGRNVLQAQVEAKVLTDGKLIENMILDSGPLATVACFWILAQLYFEKGRLDDMREYRKQYDQMLEAVLNSITYDSDQDGEEDAEQGGIVYMRLVT